MKVFYLLLLICMTPLVSRGVDAEFLGYLRGGTGLNLQGGKLECFNNVGIPGNFMRLGNECSFYSELGLVFHHKRPTSEDPHFFRTHLRLQMNAQGTQQWEPAANCDVNQIEAYVIAGGFDEVPGSIWVGKRFYRDVDLHIFDWYYYADMSGVGAGVEDIEMTVGQFSFAHLIQTNENINTNVGKPALQALDLRWKEIGLNSKDKLHLWTVYAWAPGGTDKSNSNEYVPTSGFSVAARYEGPLGVGHNNGALMYGRGAMKDFNIYASSAVRNSDDTQNRAWNVRLVENWNMDVSDRWALMVGIAGQYGDTGSEEFKHRYFYEVGIRPIYFVSDRFQWAFEAGSSRIQDDTERDGGRPVGARDLSRVTVAPQLSFNKSIWGRPILRAFLAHSFWNSENKSYVGQNASTFMDKTEGTSFGYQFEAWF